MDDGRPESRRWPTADVRPHRDVGVLGATSFVGRRVLAVAADAGWHVRAFSRRMAAVAEGTADAASCGRAAAVEWHVLDGGLASARGPVFHWLSLCPLWALASRLDWLESRGVGRLVAVSSTSRFTKIASPDPEERRQAEALATAEQGVLAWASRRGVRVTILRPTLVYDGRHDRNVAVIAAFIRRRGWFPILRPATGLRQPLHVDDLAAACVAALTTDPRCDAYDLSGGESLTYRDLVTRIFHALGLPPRFVAVPMWAARAGLPLLGLLRRVRVSPAVFLRMNEDLVFDHAPAAHDLGFRPRCFTLASDSLSSSDHRRPD